jgi:peptidoglycan/xylan/chitin deacetylase (PgdA/CDA1 family)
MLKYQKIILISVILMISLGIADFFFRINIWFYIGIIIASSGLLAIGSASIKSDFYCKAIFSFKNKDNVISLTFDDGPDKAVTPAILDILKEHNIKALFFCVGTKAAVNTEIMKRIHCDGHIIGNHSFTHHFFFDLFSKKRILKELEENDRILGYITGRKIKFFRPPYGVTNPALGSVVKTKGYHVIGWNVKSKDTVIKDEEVLFRRLTDHIGKGNIFLFHDTMEVTALMLDKFIRFAKDKNYLFERLDHLINIEAYE